MRLVRASVEVLESMTDIMPFLKGIEIAARTCYQSGDKITEDGESAKDLIKKIVIRRHWAMLEFGPDILLEVPESAYTEMMMEGFKYLHYSNDGLPIVSGSVRAWAEALINAKHPFVKNFIALCIQVMIDEYPDLQYIYCELMNLNLSCSDTTQGYPAIAQIETPNECFIHGSLIAKFITDRGVSHELVRHRPVSYAQESTRFCNYSNNLKFEGHIKYLIPCWWKDLLEEKIYEFPSIESSIFHPVNLWLTSLDVSEKIYHQLIEEKHSTHEARSVLPNSLKTEICMKAKLSEWAHWMDMRVSKAAHIQMQEVSIPLGRILLEKYGSIITTNLNKREDVLKLLKESKF